MNFGGKSRRRIVPKGDEDFTSLGWKHFESPQYERRPIGSTVNLRLIKARSDRQLKIGEASRDIEKPQAILTPRLPRVNVSPHAKIQFRFPSRLQSDKSIGISDFLGELFRRKPQDKGCIEPEACAAASERIREISAQFSEAKPDFSTRKKLFRSLLVQFQPEKAPHNIETSSQVFQYLVNNRTRLLRAKR
eukprot:TRINITY_DN13281_c0_g1_i1.p1 TRINITY_DN13281_c0_g1~~TRINITY_DN13281_c0_g1_i1.p1  ORF type:complete len:191 (+),score=11.96 TRINITY_DN13281_c0_g1_i1:125-697(+)